MSVTNDTRIIFIHGLAAKPAAPVLHRLWQTTLIENVRCDSTRLARDMNSNPALFRSAYWANAVPDHIEDTATDARRLNRAVSDTIERRCRNGKELHISRKGWVAAKAEKFGVGIVNALGTALTIKDDVINNHMREVRLYRGDQMIADRIRDPLERELREAWDDPAIERVMIISHSMGSLVAYDVLWRFSHRGEPVYRRYRDRRVEHLITMGSPLGDRVLRDSMLIERWESAPRSKNRAERVRFYPTNIGSWHNYAAYGDIVCHDATLEDDFFEGMRANIDGYASDSFRDYRKLYNPYRGRNGKPNPHKSYGYLIQPKLSYNMRWFFGV